MQLVWCVTYSGLPGLPYIRTIFPFKPIAVNIIFIQNLNNQAPSKIE